MRTSTWLPTSKPACRPAATDADRCPNVRPGWRGSPTASAETWGRCCSRMSVSKAEPATADKPAARDRILAAAVRRIASEGIDDVRIARIAMDAGVSTALVHYHFDTREALLAEALEYSYAQAGDVRISTGELPVASH